jgi:hypothetical protein
MGKKNPISKTKGVKGKNSYLSTFSKDKGACQACHNQEDL